MSAEHGGGGGNGMGFFIALFACVAVAWFFAQVEKRTTPQDDQAASASDSLFDTSRTGSVSHSVPRTHTSTSRPSDHGVTYYLDEDGNILDVVHF